MTKTIGWGAVAAKAAQRLVCGGMGQAAGCVVAHLLCMVLLHCSEGLKVDSFLRTRTRLYQQSSQVLLVMISLHIIASFILSCPKSVVCGIMGY
jgi:uncharacterized membrane protein YwzB